MVDEKYQKTPNQLEMIVGRSSQVKALDVDNSTVLCKYPSNPPLAQSTQLSDPTVCDSKNNQEESQPTNVNQTDQLIITSKISSQPKQDHKSVDKMINTPALKSILQKETRHQ